MDGRAHSKEYGGADRFEEEEVTACLSRSVSSVVGMQYIGKLTACDHLVSKNATPNNALSLRQPVGQINSRYSPTIVNSIGM